MYDQTYDPAYCPPSRTGQEVMYDTAYDRSIGDKRYVANEIYGRRSNAHSYPGNSDPYLTSGHQTTPYNTSTRSSDSKMLVNVGGVRHEIL
jgi:hypothetical protein